ncbi:COG3858 Predicted glycosyl hydrolase [Candidatus Nanopelagicaceae bacterium]
MKLPRILAPLLVLTLLAGFSTATPSSADNPPRKILTGWIPYYSIKTSLPAAINNADLIKEVMPFWYTLKFDGKSQKTVVTDLYTPANPSVPMAQTVGALRNAGFSLIPTITDGTAKDVLAGLLAKPAARSQIVETITAMVVGNNYDGIDLDFEGFAFVDSNSTWPKTAPLWTAFIKELSASLHAQKKVLSVSTPYVLDPKGTQKGYYVYAWAAIAPYIDRLRIMTYDYSVAKVGPLGPITWTERTLQYAVSVMPASKVFIGIAGYGRDWVTAVSGVCPANVASVIKGGAKAATFVMRDAQNLAASYGVTPVFNEQFGEMTFSYQKVYNGTTAAGLATSCTAQRTAWYQDAKAFALRAALVDKYRLGGIAEWTLGMEEPLALEGIRNVAKAIAPDQVTASITVDKSAIEYGDPISISGTFTIKDKSPLANVAVRIEGKSIGDSAWRLLTTATTDVTGKFTKPLLIGKATTIRAYSEGTWERGEGISNESPIIMSRLLFVTAPASVKESESFTVTGSIRPRSAGTFIQVEKLVAGKWQPFGSVLTTDAQGTFVLPISIQPKGVLTLRVSAAAEAQWPIATSAPFSILIRGVGSSELVK